MAKKPFTASAKDMKTEIIDLAKDLIRVPSVATNGKASIDALNVAKKYIGKSSNPLAFKHNGCTSYLWSNSKTVLKPKFLMLGHLDVVSDGGDSSLYEPKLEGGVLKGRGSGDMKGHVASLLYSYKHSIETNKETDIALLLTTDEEVGGFNGSKFLVDSGLSPEVLFVPDADVDFDIVTSEKAPHHFVIQARGEGGHASRSFALDNPLNKIWGFYNEVRNIFHIATNKNSWASTFDMTTIKTDSKTKNMIPSFAEASFSWRWPLEQIDFETGRKKILKIAAKFNCEVVLEEGWGQGTVSSESNPYIALWKQTIEHQLGKKVSFTNVHGSSDARHFFNHSKNGTKNLIITSAVTGGHHSSTEWVNVDSLEILSKALIIFIDKVDTANKLKKPLLGK
jgi:succinyl-diaminopimelate desuccinylase